MSVDPEPRQRTVAELLAENGGAQSGRRRRRRAAQDGEVPFDGGAPGDGTADGPSGPQAPHYRPDGEAPQNGRYAQAPQGSQAPPVPQTPPVSQWPQQPPPQPNGYPQNGYAPHGHPQNGYGVNGHEPQNGYAQNGYAPHGSAQNGSVQNGYAQDGYAQDGYAQNGHAQNGYAQNGYAQNGYPQAPPARRGAEQSLPGGVPQAPGPYSPGASDETTAAEPDSPTGAFGVRRPGPYGGPGPDTDAGGPPTQLGAPPLDDSDLDGDLDDDPDGGHDPYARDGFDERAWTGELADEQDAVDATAPHRATSAADGGAPTQVGVAPGAVGDGGAPGDTGDREGRFGPDDDYEDHGEYAAGVDDDPQQPRRSSRRRNAVAGLEDGELPDGGKPGGTGQAWAMVIAQWIGGAVVGAGVWIGFRYLWYSLPVVALSLAVVLTVALVLGVRALLRNDDLRTTMFAVLVGLLLTVSPALLVLLDR